MKHLPPALIATVLLLLSLGCGSPKNQQNQENEQPNQMEGTWQSIVLQGSHGGEVVDAKPFSFAPASCTLGTLTLEGTGNGETCFLASIPDLDGELLIGVQQDPAPQNALTQFAFLSSQTSEFSSGLSFSGSGTVSSGVITGTWICDEYSSCFDGQGQISISQQ